MLIKTRIRKLTGHLQDFKVGDQIYIILPDSNRHLEKLGELGYTIPLQAGEYLLPSGKFGRASRRNANGFEIIHRDRPKEVRYQQIQWTWKERHGVDTVEKTGIKERPYYRYPRTQTPPYSLELRIEKNKSGDFIIAAGPIKLADMEAQLDLTNAIHMFVEIFGECYLSVKPIGEAAPVVRRQLNWEILPRGAWPREKIVEAMERVINQATASNQIVLRSRFNEIAAHRPNFTATGRNGFSKYVVHGWEKANLYLLESTEVNNATYVLKDNWEAVSAMTKANILHTNAHHARMVHRESWFRDLQNLMHSHEIPREADE
ncbi:hypothetical protein Q4S45_02840 [Massilia sp. R2A-15]|uniref:hypothetical protein n=1 Tax=Massilia sp. R2A-15 TaxID=3064278 RepID=UPI0027351A9B|nr:hypothetical protein [Massilia sp. R2A-15]WLI90079.1 hypothetical protein Q4S45_02840 [Massilia sp. R2A-15]